MAATRKSAKRTARKKRGGAKRATAKKSTARKSTSRRAAKPGRRARKTKRTATLKRQAEKGIRAARGGIKTVRQVGDRAWETLKSTTAQVVEGVKDTLNREDAEPRDRYPYR